MARSKSTIREGRQPLLFLSHSGVGGDAAKALKARILATRAAKDAGLQVWFDKDDLLPGESWQSEVDAALLRATAFAVLVGSKGVVNWVERETAFALSRATGPDAIPFIPVIARDLPSSAALPAFAQHYQRAVDPLGNVEELHRLVAAAQSAKPAETPLFDEPYVGLRSMTEADAGRFFGREEEVRDLVSMLKRHRLLAISAESGVGKSSLAMAGLIPAFRGGALVDPEHHGPDRHVRHVVVMRPGSDPLEGLRRGITEAAERLSIPPDERAALRKRLDLADAQECALALRCDLPPLSTDTLLIVDELDELLTETPETERDRFLDFLTKLTTLDPGGIRIAVTIRADLFHRFRQLIDAGAGTMWLKRISDTGLEQAVVRPLALAGYLRVDDAQRLARLIRRDIGDRAGDLALAQMALYVTWRSRSHDVSLVETTQTSAVLALHW